MKILTNSILPATFRIFHEGEEGGATGSGGDDGKLGGAFTKMLADMNPDAAPAPEKEKEVAKEPTEAEKAAAAAEAEKTEKKKAEEAASTKKKRTGRDPLLDVFSGEAKKEEAAGDKKPDPAADEAARKAREAELETATKGMSGAAAANFRKVLGERDDAAAKAANLEKELAALKAAKSEIPAEVQAKVARLEALEKEHGTLTELMEKIGVERSPTFQKKFVQGRQALLEKAKGLVKKYGGDENAFAEALNLNGRERSEALANAMADMQSFDVQRVAGVMTELESLDDEAAAYLGNARKSLQDEERNAQAQEQAHAAEVSKLREAKFTEVANRMLRKFPDDHPLAAEANPMVDKAVAAAKQFLFENTEFDTFAQAAIAHALFPEMQKRLSSAGELIAKLEAQIEELTEADPGNAGSGGSGGAATKEEKGFAGRFTDAMTTPQAA